MWQLCVAWVVGSVLGPPRGAAGLSAQLAEHQEQIEAAGGAQARASVRREPASKDSAVAASIEASGGLQTVRSILAAMGGAARAEASASDSAEAAGPPGPAMSLLEVRAEGWHRSQGGPTKGPTGEEGPTGAPGPRGPDQKDESYLTSCTDNDPPYTHGNVIIPWSEVELYCFHARVFCGDMNATQRDVMSALNHLPTMFDNPAFSSNFVILHCKRTCGKCPFIGAKGHPGGEGPPGKAGPQGPPGGTGLQGDQGPAETMTPGHPSKIIVYGLIGAHAAICFVVYSLAKK